MARSRNAQLAVDLYNQLDAEHHWNADTAWQGIARLLLSCEIYIAQAGWRPFHGVVTYVDSNRFTVGDAGPHATLRRAEQLTEYLAGQLGVPRPDLCANIGTYFQQAHIRRLQPNNPVGHAYRSLATNALQRFGDPGITYEEEVNPHAEFPGQVFTTRSKRARIDIVARRENRTVALLSVRWRVRHDRLDVVDEAIAYAPASQRHNPHSRVYAVLGEFDCGRLRKVLDNCPPIIPHAAIHAAVHYAPQLITEGLQENGTMQYLRSLSWLINETFTWR